MIARYCKEMFFFFRRVLNSLSSYYPDQTQDAYGVFPANFIQELEERPWQTRTHCCRHKCFPVCPRAQHLRPPRYNARQLQDIRPSIKHDAPYY